MTQPSPGGPSVTEAAFLAWVAEQNRQRPAGRPPYPQYISGAMRLPFDAFVAGGAQAQERIVELEAALEDRSREVHYDTHGGYGSWSSCSDKPCPSDRALLAQPPRQAEEEAQDG